MSERSAKLVEQHSRLIENQVAGKQVASQHEDARLAIAVQTEDGEVV